MTNMIDTYLASSNENGFRLYLSFFSQVIGPQKGREAVPEGVDEDGNIVPAIPAVGDPSMFYACVRALVEIVPPEGIDTVDANIGAGVIGVWA